jgi:hypoxia up-regulated 1
VHRTPLDIKISGLPMEPLTETQIDSSIRVLGDLRKKDEAKRAQEAAKSNLEAYIYSMRAKLDEESIQEVTDEEQRSALKDLLMDKEDWLYMDGADASTEEFKKTHSDLQTQGDAMEFRAAELTKRPETVKKARAFIEKAKTEIETWAEKKPWLNATRTTELLEEITQFESWLDEKEEEQNKLSKTEPPALESTEIKISQRPLEAKFKKLKNKPKPKPPKVEASNTTDANATDANATTVGGDEDPVAEDFNATTSESTLDEQGAGEEEEEDVVVDDGGDGDDDAKSDAGTDNDVKDEL